MAIFLIAAVAENGIIGKDNSIPWHLPEDLKRFKKLTIGHPVVMGRKTFESIVARLGTPLPGRKNIVVTRQENFRVPEEVLVYHSVHDAFAAHKDEDIFVIGGAEIYRQTIDKADTLYITRVHQKVEGDARFPDIQSDEWKIATEENHDGYSFVTYNRIRKSN